MRSPLQPVALYIQLGPICTWCVQSILLHLQTVNLGGNVQLDALLIRKWDGLFLELILMQRIVDQ